ncbi:phage tail tape measure protein [Bacillus cereus]|nr:phage tail tape measure protein [Bacillus cereus]MDA2572757.1 phage tail tape measure protein [Bacillus cereus]
MATPSKETIVKFKADTKDYEERIKALNQSNRMLNQGLNLEMGLSLKEVDTVMKKMGDSFLKWSQEFSVSIEVINKGLHVLVEDGYSASEAIEIMNTSLYTAQGTNEDLLTVVDQLGSSLQAYGMKKDNATQTIQNMAQMAYVFAYISNHTKASIYSLGSAFCTVGATAAAMGQPMEVTAAAIGILESNGVEASDAARALKGGIVNLVKPTKSMKRSLDDMNVSVFDAQEKMKPLPQLLNEMEQGMEGWTEEERRVAVQIIFDKMYSSRWNILLHKGGDYLDKIAGSAKNVKGYYQSAYEG